MKFESGQSLLTCDDGHRCVDSGMSAPPAGKYCIPTRIRRHKCRVGQMELKACFHMAILVIFFFNIVTDISCLMCYQAALVYILFIIQSKMHTALKENCTMFVK